MNSTARQKRMLKLRVWILGTVGVAAFSGFSFMILTHADYYRLGSAERPFHGDHSILKPTGAWGLPAGLVATVLIVLNLAYLIRKRWVRVTWLGPLRMWMDLHVLTGLLGGGLILLHSAMQPMSALGTSAATALLITILTGIIGRTIYIQVPRSLDGHELELAQVTEELEQCRLELGKAGLAAELPAFNPPKIRASHSSLLACFAAMLRGYRERQRAYQTLKRHIRGSQTLEWPKRRILALARSYCIHAQWVIHYQELRTLIASWRFFHRWLAVLMLCVVVCHILVAFRFSGFSWGGLE